MMDGCACADAYKYEFYVYNFFLNRHTVPPMVTIYWCFFTPTDCTEIKCLKFLVIQSFKFVLPYV